MPKTAIGLFEKGNPVEEVIREIEALGLPREEIRTLAEPATFEITNRMSFPRLDYEVDLRRELTRLGASQTEVEAYINGLRHGGALVLATGSGEDNKADAAADVMNRHGAIGTEEITGPGPRLPRVAHEGVTPVGPNPVLAGRVRQSSGACVFVW